MHKYSGLKAGVLLALVTMSLSACNPASDVAAGPGAAANDAVVREPTRAPEVCAACGTVSSIIAVQDQGKGTGVGAVLGALVGGLAGNQVGGGDGKKLATVAGVIGGAVVGNKIEGDRKDLAYYEVTIDMDAGGQRTIIVPDSAGIHVGSAVSVSGTNISLR